MVLEHYLEERNPKQSRDLIEPKYVLPGDDIVSQMILLLVCALRVKQVQGYS